MQRLGHSRDFAVDRAYDLSVFRDDGGAVAQNLLGEDLVRHFAQCDHLAAQRRDDLLFVVHAYTSSSFCCLRNFAFVFALRFCK